MVALIALIACSQNAPADAETEQTIAALDASSCGSTEYGSLCDVPAEDESGPYAVECLIDGGDVSCAASDRYAEVPGCMDLEFGVYCAVTTDEFPASRPAPQAHDSCGTGRKQAACGEANAAVPKVRAEMEPEPNQRCHVGPKRLLCPRIP